MVILFAALQLVVLGLLLTRQMMHRLVGGVQKSIHSGVTAFSLTIVADGRGEWRDTIAKPQPVNR